MWRDRAAANTERVKRSRFVREIVGPKVAAPLATWLQDNLVDYDSDASRSEHDEAHAPSAAAEAEPRELSLAEPEGKQPDETVPATGRTKGVLGDLKDRIKDHNLVVVAAGIAFWGLLAIPAMLFATVSIAGLVLDPTTVKAEVDSNLDGLPVEVRTIIGDQLENVSGSSAGGLITGLIVGILLALWTTSGAMAKMMSTMNTIYGSVERRKFWVLRGVAALLTFGGILFVSGAVFLLAALPPVLDQVDAVGDSANSLLRWLRFPALGLVMVIGLGVLYHLGPDRKGRYRVFTLGAFAATVLWLCLSGLFTIYTSTVDSYNETYGSLGGLVVLLLWLFITAFVVLVGAEIHALTSRDSDPAPPVVNS